MGQRGRDAGNGQFIPLDEAKRRPGSTVIEKTPPPKKPTGGGKGGKGKK